MKIEDRWIGNFVRWLSDDAPIHYDKIYWYYKDGRNAGESHAATKRNTRLKISEGFKAFFFLIYWFVLLMALCSGDWPVSAVMLVFMIGVGVWGNHLHAKDWKNQDHSWRNRHGEFQLFSESVKQSA